VDTRIVRIFNTYGPRMRLRDGRVVPNIIAQALVGEPLTIHGDGSQTRSFCFMDDLIEGFWRLMHSDYHEPVNIGNPNELTILEFAEKIIALTGSTSTLERHPRPVDDPKVRRPDISLARSLFGWEPTIDLDEGLRRTIAYFRPRVTAASSLPGSAAR
jgi:dTDP-glucose 4,6-dehydratase